MKKVLILLIFPFLAISCRDFGDKTQIQTINLRVNQSDWIESTDNDGRNRYYSCSFFMPEITPAVYEYGSVQAYVTFDNTQQVMPYVRHYEDINGNRWTRTVDYDYSEGNLIVYVTNSDFIRDLPETMTFRVVLMWQD